jgi:hypothetical protein
MQCGRGPGSFLKSGLWGLHQAVQNRKTRSLSTPAIVGSGASWNTELEYNGYLWNVYKQAVSKQASPPPYGCILASSSLVRNIC